MGKKILFINQEITPYVPETELSNYGSNLPNLMLEAGYEIRTFMPKWGGINERRGQLHEVYRLSRMNLTIDDTDHLLYIKVATFPQTRIQVYFTDNEDYFQKRSTMTVDENGAEYKDNGERAIFFARGVLETVKKLHWAPDIIHCQGWMTSVLPFYIKTAYKDEPEFANAKVVTSLFDQQPAGALDENFKACLPYQDATAEHLQKYADTFDALELGKLAMDYSDAIVSIGDKVDKHLLDYAKASSKEMLEDDGNVENLKEKYDEFYKKLIGE